MVEHNQEQNLITNPAKLLGSFLNIAYKTAATALDYYWQLVKTSSLIFLAFLMVGLLIMEFGSGVLVSIGLFLVGITIFLYSLIILPILWSINKISERDEGVLSNIRSLILLTYFASGWIYFSHFWINKQLFHGFVFLLGFIFLSFFLSNYTFRSFRLIKWFSDRVDIVILGLMAIGTILAIIPEPLLARILRIQIPGTRAVEIMYDVNNIRNIEFFDQVGNPKLKYLLDDSDGCPSLFDVPGSSITNEARTGKPFLDVTNEIREITIKCAEQKEISRKEEIKRQAEAEEARKQEEDKRAAEELEILNKKKREEERQRNIEVARNIKKPPIIKLEPGLVSEPELRSEPQSNNPRPPMAVPDISKETSIVEKPSYVEVRRNFKSLRVVNDSLISSDNLNVGDLIMGTVIEDAETEDKKFKVVKNSKILLRVISIEKAGTGGPAIRLEPFNISLASDGSTIRTNSDPIRIDRRTKPYLSKKAVAGGVAGGILGGIFGGKKGAAAGAGAGYGAGLAAEILTRGNEIQISEKFPIEFKDVTFTDHVYEETRVISRF